VNDVVGVAGFALPGSFVDVLVSAKDASDVPFSTTVLTRVKVLAVAQETQADQMKPKVVNAVTLELTPPEAEKLDLARSIGALSLVLRNENDAADVESAVTRLNDILRASQPAPAAAAPKTAAPRPVRSESSTVTSIRGISKRQEQP
jgi:pilus assembly protein CpaB